MGSCKTENKVSYKIILEACSKVLDWKTGYLLIQNWYPEKTDLFMREMLAVFNKAKAYEESARISKKMKAVTSKIFVYYLKSQNYKKAKTCLIANELNENETRECLSELSIAVSIELNAITQTIKNVIYWKNRLEIVQKLKLEPEQDEQTDMNDGSSYQSKDSVISGASGSSQISKFTGMSLQFKSKNKKPKNLISRKLKEGSLYEEEWLVLSINKTEFHELQVKSIGHFMAILINFNMLVEFKELKEIINRWAY